MSSGRIIFLNGTSSSGKSSIARELLDILDDGAFFHLAVDGFNAMRTKRALAPDELDAALRRTRMGFHRSIAAMAEAGNDIVVDHVLSEPWRLLDCLTVLQPEDVLFVGVHCPPDELARRELARGDRPPGLAERPAGQDDEAERIRTAVPGGALGCQDPLEIRPGEVAVPQLEVLRVVREFGLQVLPGQFEDLGADVDGAIAGQAGAIQQVADQTAYRTRGARPEIDDLYGGRWRGKGEELLGVPGEEAVDVTQHRHEVGVGRHFARPPHFASLAEVGQLVGELGAEAERIGDRIHLGSRVEAIEVSARGHHMPLYTHGGE